MLLFLLVVIPGRGEAVGFNEIRDAVALWHRVFGTLPALEQFIQEGRPPRVQNVEKLGAALEAVSREEASNPFLPLARGALFTLTKSGQVKGQAAKASSLAGDRVAVRWLLYKAFLDLGQGAAADRELRRIREIRDRLGLDRITYLGWYLAQSAKTLAARQNLQEAEKALALAAEFDPALPEVFFAQARILLGRGSPRGLVPLVKGWWISLTSPTYGLSHWANILASFLFAIPLILLLVGLLLIVRVTHLFGHDLAERKRQRLSPTAQAFLPIPIYLLPVLLGLGLLPSLLLSLLLLGIYLKGRERLLWGGLVLSLLLLPSGYRLLATMITTTTSPRFVALLRVEEGSRGQETEAALRRWTNEAPHDPLPRFYLGQVLRSRGELQKGIKAYSQVQTSGSPEAAVWTNRGNLALLAGNLAEAQSAYEKAIALSPDLAYPRFNLSQLLTERLLLEKAQEEYAQAIREMPTLEARMKQAVADGRKRVIVDAPFPVTGLWHRIPFLDSSSPEMAEIIWGGRFLGVSLAQLRWMVGGYFIAFGGIFWFRKRRRFARACQECGRAFCPRCQRLLGEIRLCTRCAIIERVRSGEAPPTVKSVPVEEVQREPRWLGVALALIPGIEGIYRGRILWGFLLLTVTLFVISPLLGAHLAPATYLPGAPLPYHVSVSILVLVCLYMLTALTTTGRRRRRAKEARWR